MYEPICKQESLTIGTGTVVVVTGWTPVNTIARQIDPSQYAAIGNLYSPQGVEYLARNVLANPFVTGILALNFTKQDDNAGAIAALQSFWNNTDISIDGIPKEDIDRLRSLKLFVVNEKPKILEFLGQLKKQLPLGGDPKHYYPKIVSSRILPGAMYGHRIEGKTIADTWTKILHLIRSTGRESPSGYGVRQELIDLMAIVTEEPEDLFVPDWLPVNREYLSSYFPQLLDDAPSGVKYTYGSRLRSHFGVDQIEQVIKKLSQELDAASAVMNLWDARDHEMGGSPCLNHIWVRMIDNELSLTAVFRSNDMFDAWCANAFGLRRLQGHIRDRIAQETGIQLGLDPLITLSQSAHIYSHSYAYADKMIEEKYQWRSQEYDDPVGNFEIELTDGNIVISRTLPYGNVCAQYKGRNPEKLAKEILRDAPAIAPDHALYLGKELYRASDCLRCGVRYRQQ